MEKEPHCESGKNDNTISLSPFLSLKPFSLFFFLLFPCLAFSTYRPWRLSLMASPYGETRFSCCSSCLALLFFISCFDFDGMVVLQGLYVEDEECGRGEMLAVRWGW